MSNVMMDAKIEVQCTSLHELQCSVDWCRCIFLLFTLFCKTIQASGMQPQIQLNDFLISKMKKVILLEISFPLSSFLLQQSFCWHVGSIIHTLIIFEVIK